MDCPMEWPEPIVRVQSLSDNGARVIPDKYVKPKSERPGLELGSVGSGDDSTVPVIDLADLVGGAVERGPTVRAIFDACREWGFFQVVNHGVSLDLMEKTREKWREFFYLPMETKEVYAKTPVTEGYGSRLGVQKGAILDWCDYYLLNLFPEAIRNHDKWPNLPANLRETTEAYGGELVKLCEILMRALSISLGLEETFLEEAFGGEEVSACMRANYYPKCPQPDLTLGLSAHSDPGGLTILLLDDRVKGLQVRRGDTWVTVQPVPNSFIVNCGDQIQVLSNAIFKSVEHRVIVNSIDARLSIAFFYNPKGDRVISPAQELVTQDQPPLYKSMTFNEYKLFIMKNGPRGKSQVESLKVV